MAGLAAIVVGFSGYSFAQEARAHLTFSAAQMAGGRANYASKCAKCHGDDLEGGAGPALSGGGLDNYLTGSVGDLSDFISSSMPQDAPGSLSPEETATVVAYLASKNGRAPGAAPLPIDSTTQHRMDFMQ